MSDYVVLKLVTGEQILATLLTDDTFGVVVLDPVLVRMVPYVKNGNFSEQAVTSMFCQFSESNRYTFSHRNILFCNELESSLVSFYKKVVISFTDDKPEEHVTEDVKPKINTNRFH